MKVGYMLQQIARLKAEGQITDDSQVLVEVWHLDGTEFVTSPRFGVDDGNFTLLAEEEPEDEDQADEGQ